MIEKKLQIGDLYAFYGQLLTQHQQLMVELNIYEDLSLGEIAEQLFITRQAVYDAIKKSEKILLNYEIKLGLVEKFKLQKKSLNFINDDIISLTKYINGNKEAQECINSIIVRLNQLNE